MPQYLSQDWLNEFVALTADQPARPGATVEIQYKVTRGGDGDRKARQKKVNVVSEVAA